MVDLKAATRVGKSDISTAVQRVASTAFWRVEHSVGSREWTLAAATVGWKGSCWVVRWAASTELPLADERAVTRAELTDREKE